MKNETAILKSKLGRDFLIDFRYIPSQKPKAVVLFVHGFKGFKDWGHFNVIADVFAEQGFVYVKLNLSHNGTTVENPTDFVDLEAFGQNNFSKELDDIDDVINHLHDLNDPEMDLDKIFIIGHSRGGGLALLKAAEDSRIKKVVTWAAIHDLEKRWPQSFLDTWKEKGVHYIINGRTNQEMPLYYQLVEDFKTNKQRLDIPEGVKGLKIPLLVCHGTADETLDVRMAHEITSWNSLAELFIIEGANHTFDGKHPFEGRQLPEDTLRLIDKSIHFLKN